MEAAGLLQDWVGRIGDGTLRRECESYFPDIGLPLGLVTETAQMASTTEAEVRRGFDGLVAVLRKQQVSDCIRPVASAKSVGDRPIGTYVPHLLAESIRVLPRVESSLSLQRTGQVWRATAISNSLNNDRRPRDVPGVTPRH
jgi:hypothetical protein